MSSGKNYKYTNVAGSGVTLKYGLDKILMNSYKIWGYCKMLRGKWKETGPIHIFNQFSHRGFCS